MRKQTEIDPAVRTTSAPITAVVLSAFLVLTLAACIGGRKPLSGPDVKITPSAAIRVLSVAPIAEVHDVANRGISVRVLVEGSAQSTAVVILFAGGRGVTKISDQGLIGRLKGNFLVRSRYRFRAHGFMTAIFDSPSDWVEDLRPIHDGTAFASDVGAVIRHLRSLYDLPVWVIGTSRGTVAAANAASRLGKNKPDGAVFTASLFDGNQTASVFDLPLEKVQIPSLIVHHKKDACVYTWPGDVPRFKERLSQAKAVDVMWFDGGYSRGDDCQARSYHGFNGIEDRVVAMIAQWIKKSPPAASP
ncbi:MAG: alpha/beta hydrolase [Rhodospirillaceae bacterium]|jgi:hypothetical protein|nr:alpha/beta hydrolase [Rhodospirillaceae bacterium]MBT5190714.1 alpha/beta hydrolase [Rhodospirillaceae bacterium]MBT5895191.1 alpha/beta hydrolase [Rhodospirillaceae bacterium]MBT6430290.1 alpha/beta hydrolase [Rhodospirillaceae bacterium]MBT7760841.1 alpha/beta hydrolase [Rhodospirillaceae bacterium]